MKCVLCGAKKFSPIHKLKKCVHCGLVQVAPMPGVGEIRKLYHEDLEHFEPYIAQISVHREYFQRKVSEIKVLSAQGAWLDIGCALGIFLEEAKKAGFRVQGIDISKDAVEYCRKKGFRVNLRFGLGHEVFDVVTAFEVIEHERNPLGMMRRVHTLLKNEGIVVLTTPNHSSIWRKIMGKWWVGYHHPEHVTFWDTRSLTYLMKNAGFQNVEVRRDSPRPFPLSFLLTRGADYFPWFGWLLRPLGRVLDQFNLRNPINPWDDLIVFARKLR